MIWENKSLARIPLAFAAVCLAGGYAIAGRWIGVPIILLWCLAWWFMRKMPGSWTPPLLLAAAVCLSGFGLLSGAPTLLMIISAAAALAGWDLALMEQAPGSQVQIQRGTRLRSRHLQSLAIALLLGITTAALGSIARLQIPFWLMLLLVVLAFAALDRVARGLIVPGQKK